MTGAASQIPAPRHFRGVCVFLALLFFQSVALRAQDASFTNLLAQGGLHEKQGDTRAALQSFLDAERLSPTNASLLCRIAKQSCDMMHIAKSKAEQKDFAAKSLEYALRAVAADPKDPQSHLAAAVCYAKNFPYSDNQTKIKYSRQIKSEAEAAIALDPKYDLPYHMLGRWNCEVANMNILLTGLVKIIYGGLPKASNDAAIQNFKKAIELAPNRIIHHLLLAHVYHIVGNDKQMTDELKTCTTLSPTDLDDGDAKRIATKVLETHKWPAEF